MDIPHGRIVSLDMAAHPPRVLVEVSSKINCARCAAGKGCGAGLFGAGGRRRHVEALLAENLDLRQGDRVQIDLAPQHVLLAAAIVYGLPLGGALSAAAFSYLAGSGDAVAAVAALIGIVFGFVAGRRWLRHKVCRRRFIPIVTARLGSPR